ncbi:Oidioi.mRNA.OKI2018_I69.chr1.g1453.t1.cds [Oikopleura dioica]|uniref:Oidioi.mRNA.OKI2018_I69.chr1.g1453.t1.cds n=1 Tax=Oikopleura dioica TaxID=34765 RepID=A0ABN7ST74_OIKDI|nr:Oidioi.mRNA.OKI2018_I69.chr1.g1453.t1.cds [Oikopleura dioica]
MTEEFRRSTLQKIRNHPNSQILFELIFKRLQFEDLALMAPIVLEKTDNGYGTFDSLFSPDFSSYALNRHYKSDAILALVGEEFYRENERKPETLSEVAQIIQKRIDLRNNRKNLEKKTTIKFSTDKPLVRFSHSYLVTNNESKPKGFECKNSEDDLLFFKINRENTAPKLELAHPWFLTKDNPYNSSEMVSMWLYLQTSKGIESNPDGKWTWCVSDSNLKFLDHNISRQRTWRNLTAYPQRNIHPILKENRHLEDKEKDEMPMTINFVNFSNGESKLIWSFDFVRAGSYYQASHITTRFLDDGLWLVMIDVYDVEGNDKILFFNLEKKEVKSYQLPYQFIVSSAFYGFSESSLYYLREADNPYGGEDKYLVFGYFYREERLTDTFERHPDLLKHLCFFERGELTKKSGLKIGIKGLVHLVLDQYDTESKVFTIKIDEIKKLLLEAETFTCELSFPGQWFPGDVPAKATLPLIKLDELCTTKYEDLSENLNPEQSDIGYMDGNKLHLFI